ncbi:MAG: TrkH family potassium uptake protein [Myxococcota bacterium]
MKRYRDYRGVARPVGFVVMGLGVAIAACAAAGWAFNAAMPPLESSHQGGEIALGIASAISLVLGLVLFTYGGRYASEVPTRREAMLAVAMIWTAAMVIGALPFVIGAGMDVPDALFESVSGLTTTGATVITDIETRLSRPLLLWRSLLQWLGGMGIVVLFVAVFPNIGAGGKYMFGEEVPGTSAEGLRPRIAETSRVLYQFYIFFTVLEIGVLWLLGMSPFEAICHAFTTMSTGGFSTRDASIAAFQDERIEFTLAGFMLLASVNYGLFFAALRGRTLRVFVRSAEFKSFVTVVLVASVLMTFVLLGYKDGNIYESFRYSFFMVATIISSTGYGIDEYMTYPAFALAIILSLMFMGGCAGSTAGGIKVERFVLMTKLAWTELRRSFRPNLVHVVRMGRSVVSQAALTDVSVFIVVYLGSLGALTGIITALEAVSLPQAFGSSLTCLSNMGPAPFHGQSDSFAAYSTVSKICFSIAMLLGRLEFFAVLALLVPDFWKR